MSSFRLARLKIATWAMFEGIQELCGPNVGPLPSSSGQKMDILHTITLLLHDPLFLKRIQEGPKFSSTFFDGM